MPNIQHEGPFRKRLVSVGLTLFLLLAAPVAVADDSGDCNAIGQLPKVDLARAVVACQRLAERGDIIAEYNLGLMYYGGQGVAQNYPEAVKLFQKAAEQGDAPSQYSLGLVYEEGRGVEQDYVEAAMWYRKAAAQGYVSAQSALGFMYGTGDELPADYVQAYLWLSLAAKAGDDDASDYRDLMVKDMAPEQLTEAIRLVSNWQPSMPEDGQPVY